MELDFTKVNDINNELQQNVQSVSDLLNKVVQAHTEALDQIMLNIKQDVIDNPYGTPIEIIEKYFVELSNSLYFISAAAERLGLYDSIGRSMAKETYNNSYMDDSIAFDENGKKRTVAELTALSENASIYEQTVSDIYNKAYKIVKVKISSAENMYAALSKILSRKMAELQMSSVQPATFNNRKILNEG